MKKLNPSDLEKIIKQGNNIKKVKIDDLIREVNKALKKILLHSKIDILGENINVTTTKTRFNGNKFWFICPLCFNRCGVLYLENGVKCTKCYNDVYI